MNEYSEQLLNEYLDDTLSDAQRQEAEKLLHDSAVARAFLADLQFTFAALDGLDELPLMVDLSVPLLAKIDSPTPIWVRWLMAVQFAAATFLMIQLWPTIQRWLMGSIMMTATLAAELSWPQFSLGRVLAGWETAVMQPFQTGIPSLGLATNQWGLLILLAFAAWVAGNRLLFSEKVAKGQGAR